RTTAIFCLHRPCSGQRCCSSPMPSAGPWWPRPNCPSASSRPRPARLSSSGSCCASAASSTSERAPMITASRVSISIGRKPIVSDVDFEARAGEISAIVGPNGSGKTTFLRGLSGDAAYEGRISINGSELRSLKPWQAATLRAVLPQQAAMAFPFTVREVVKLGLTGGRSGLPAVEEAGLPERALARVDLDGFAGRYYQELSGGEQQRVQLARVLCQVWKPVL